MKTYFLPKTEAQLGSDRWHNRFANYLFLFFLLLMIFFALLPWQQTAVGTGKVIAYSPSERQQVVNATIDGRIEHWYVQEGQLVKRGDPIVKLSDIDSSLVARLEAEKSAVQVSLHAAQQSVLLTKTNMQRQNKLFHQGISSKRQYEQATIAYNNAMDKKANNEIKLRHIETRLSRQGGQLITAPIDGTILRRMAGNTSVIVHAGSHLATLVPKTNSRAVALWLDGNDIPLVSVGQKVRLQFEGWPAVQFSGWPAVSVGTFPGIVRNIDMADDGHGRFRVLIVPPRRRDWPEDNYLRQGVRANGWVLLGVVRLGYELWRQLNGFPPARPRPSDSEHGS